MCLPRCRFAAVGCRDASVDRQVGRVGAIRVVLRPLIMRSRSFFILLLVLGACRDHGPLAPMVPAAIPSPLVSVAATAVAPRVIACGGGPRQGGPLFIVNERIVSDSVGRLAAATEGAVIEVVPDSLAAQLYGSRAYQGVIIITSGAPRVAARDR